MRRSWLAARWRFGRDVHVGLIIVRAIDESNAGDSTLRKAEPTFQPFMFGMERSLTKVNGPISAAGQIPWATVSRRRRNIAPSVPPETAGLRASRAGADIH